MKKLLLTLVLGTSLACTIPVSEGSQKAQRRPLERSSASLKSPTEYLKRESGPVESRDPRPRVELVDAKAGKYALKWVGIDGREKVVEYQRADAIDAVVAATVSRTPEGRYLYTYRVQNLASSPTHLSSFAVQNFAADARPAAVNGRPTNGADVNLLTAFRGAAAPGETRNFEGLHFGQMSERIHEFREGTWLRMAILSDFEPAATPGREIELTILSSAPPGVVGCRVTAGNLTLKGVGEHMPTELENAMPGYEEWPKGFTVGPVERLAGLPLAERLKYLADRLPQFEQLGWMTPAARGWYEKSLAKGDAAALLARAEADLQAEQITSEVYAMLRGLEEK